MLLHLRTKIGMYFQQNVITGSISPNICTTVIASSAIANQKSKCSSEIN